MRLGKELIGKPIYSVTDGRQLGSVKDIYLDIDLGVLNGIFLGHEGLFNRKAKVITREDITVFGYDAVLVNGSDVETDSNETPEVDIWLRRESVLGRDIETPGGTKVGTVGDILFDERATVVGFSLARVYVSGPVAEKRMIMKDAISDTGGKEGIVKVDLSKAEKGKESIADMPEISDDLQVPDSSEAPTETAEEESAE
jgi:uncharacterized protein YrrD